MKIKKMSILLGIFASVFLMISTATAVPQTQGSCKMDILEKIETESLNLKEKTLDYVPLEGPLYWLVYWITHFLLVWLREIVDNWGGRIDSLIELIGGIIGGIIGGFIFVISNISEFISAFVELIMAIPGLFIDIIINWFNDWVELFQMIIEALRDIFSPGQLQIT